MGEPESRPACRGEVVRVVGRPGPGVRRPPGWHRTGAVPWTAGTVRPHGSGGGTWRGRPRETPARRTIGRCTEGRGSSSAPLRRPGEGVAKPCARGRRVPGSQAVGESVAADPGTGASRRTFRWPPRGCVPTTSGPDGPFPRPGCGREASPRRSLPVTHLSEVFGPFRATTLVALGEPRGAAERTRTPGPMPKWRPSANSSRPRTGPRGSRRAGRRRSRPAGDSRYGRGRGGRGPA